MGEKSLPRCGGCGEQIWCSECGWVPPGTDLALAWTADPPTVPGDYLYAYRFEPDGEWAQGRMKITADELPVEPDTSDTRWFGPIPRLEGPAVGA